MSLADIIRNGKGTSHAWRVVSDDPEDGFTPWVYRTLWHYSAPMVTWREWRRSSPHPNAGTREIVRMGLGHGSVSDQRGMNTFFKELSFPYRYSRAGGAHILPE